jgi:hypothetical protein
MRVCSIEGCNEKHQAKGYCKQHYTRLIQTPAILKKRTKQQPRITRLCSVDNCDKKHWQHGYCRSHFFKLVTKPKMQSMAKPKYECSYRDCQRTTRSESRLCGYHINIKYGDVKGEHNHNWNGGTSEYKDHYLMKKLRLEKLESVNYICESCGGVAVEIHHKDRDKTHHELNNFLAVCKKCHRNIHCDQLGRPRKYGIYTLKETSAILQVSIPTIYKYLKNPEDLQIKTYWLIDKFFSENKT